MSDILLSKMGYARCNVQQNRDGIKNLPANWTVPADINEGKTITFKFNYTWNNNTCNITNIQWTPTQFIDGEWTSVDSSNNPIAFSTPFFTATDKIEIKFGGTPETVSDVTLNRGSIADTSRNNISAAYLSASFTYSYTVKYEDGDWVAVSDNDTPGEYSFIEYFIKIDNIRIPKTNKYENNVVFTEAAVEELVDNIKKYPVINIETINQEDQDEDSHNIWEYYTDGQPCVRIDYGNQNKIIQTYSNQSLTTQGFKYVKVGSNIKFKNGADDLSELSTNPMPAQTTGTFRVSINNKLYEVPIAGLAGTSSGNITLNGTTEIDGHLLPKQNESYDIGSPDIDTDPNTITPRKWRTIYTINLGSSTTPITNAYITTATITNLNTPLNTALSMSGPISISNTTDGIKYNSAVDDQPENWVNGFDENNTRIYSGDSSASISTFGGIYAAKNIYAARVFNAVFNDYAECRTTINLTPGHVVIDQDDGSLVCSSKRLQPGAQVISDTYGHLMGATDKATTPIAVAGRVLVYTYQPRENYHAGMAVCSAPDGTVDIMSRAEICEYPDCIVGIVSEIPQYETWGSGNVKVDGRIWIKVR